MDVKLRLHPQWIVRIADPTSKIDARWNLGMLNVEEGDFLVKEGKVFRGVGVGSTENMRSSLSKPDRGA